MLKQRRYSVTELAGLLRDRDAESRQVFCKLMEILVQTKAMQEKLESVISRFDQISHKTQNQKQIFYDNVKNLQTKLNNQENLLKEKLHLHVTAYFRKFEGEEKIEKEEKPLETMEGQSNASLPKGPASLTKAQKNACNRIRKIRDKLKGTNIEALNLSEGVQKARLTRQ